MFAIIPLEIEERFQQRIICMSHEEFLKPGRFVDNNHPAVIEYANENIGDAESDHDKVINLYYAIRDGIYYDPYMPISDPASYRASDAVITQRGWCVPKAALMAACCRIHGIPARPGYADVKNHLTSSRLLELLGTDVFVWHSYCDIYVNDNWVKATPAFTKALCDKFKLHPLEFDGFEDSLFHEFDQEGKKHMQYLQDRGTFADVPFEKILETCKGLYKPEYIAGASGDLYAEAGT